MLLYVDNVGRNYILTNWLGWKGAFFSSTRNVQFASIMQKVLKWFCMKRHTTLFPGSFLSQEKDPGWLWSHATQIIGGNK